MRIGDMDVHGSSSHQVTGCVHHHSDKKKETGGLKPKVSQTAAPKSMQTEQRRLADAWSPADWLRSTLQRGKRLALLLWGEGKTEGNGEISDKNAEGFGRATMQREVQRHSPNETQGRTDEMAAYFVMPEREQPRQGVFTRIWTRVQNVSGYLKKRLPFAQTGSFQAKQQNREEDLRRHSRYRKDDQEIDCILTDDSYLLDSYNRKGEYSKISTEHKK